MKSSSQTIIFRYFFPIVMIGMPLVAIFLTYSQVNEEMIGFLKGFAVMYIWMLYFLIQMPIRLKNIEAKEKGILIDNKQIIDYNDIIWLAKFDITAPYFITIKYRDRVSGSDKKIAFMPNQRNQKMFGDDSLTTFIKEMMKGNDSNFSREQAPSSIKNFLYLLLLGLPFTLLALYFVNETFNFF